MKGKNFILSLVIYPFDVMVSIGEKDEDLYKRIEKHIELSDKEKRLLQIEKYGTGRAMMLEGGQSILRLPRSPKTDEEYGTLAHEIFHIVDFLFRRINIPLCSKSDEAYAYLIQYLTTEIYKKL